MSKASTHAEALHGLVDCLLFSMMTYRVARISKFIELRALGVKVIHRGLWAYASKAIIIMLRWGHSHLPMLLLIITSLHAEYWGYWCLISTWLVLAYCIVNISLLFRHIINAIIMKRRRLQIIIAQQITSSELASSGLQWQAMSTIISRISR